MASRWGWMRMGARWSRSRDWAIMEDSRYSCLASSCRRRWVDFFTLGGEEQEDRVRNRETGSGTGRQGDGIRNRETGSGTGRQGQEQRDRVRNRETGSGTERPGQEQRNRVRNRETGSGTERQVQEQRDRETGSGTGRQGQEQRDRVKNRETGSGTERQEDTETGRRGHLHENQSCLLWNNFDSGPWFQCSGFIISCLHVVGFNPFCLFLCVTTTFVSFILQIKNI